MPTTICPECTEDVFVDAESEQGDTVSCDECGATLVVVGLDPIELDLRPDEEAEQGPGAAARTDDDAERVCRHAEHEEPDDTQGRRATFSNQEQRVLAREERGDACEERRQQGADEKRAEVERRSERHVRRH